MKLTKNDISWLEKFTEIPDDVLTIDCKHENLEELRKQILGDYEKARKWDNYNYQLKVTFKADGSYDFECLINKENQKLRELIEKRIEYVKTHEDDYFEPQVMKSELQKLLEESKK